ncbi:MULTISPECIES: iron-containing redox enzyme family protein [unclassified Streptomyces]|uniref:iron-containing redox enzyme family protein n=1 Tax=unclassified Streptomyces TaxID=2593676 RepID=UPI00381AD17C
MTTVSGISGEPAVPSARGPLSALVTDALTSGPPPRPLPAPDAECERTDPYGDDLQLALHVCYELHYRGLADVDASWEWDPALLRFRAALEAAFESALRADTRGVGSAADLEAELDTMLVEPVDGTSVGHYLRDRADWDQLREYFVHRSVYQLKEADPQAWVIPRLAGRAKAALVAVEYDEFGAGRAERVHAQLFADLMRDAGLDPVYGHYVDSVPAVTLATVNLVSHLGLHRRLRGALVGHFAAGEITTAPSARRLVQAIDRLGGGAACRHFYAEHIDADAVHEQVMRRDVLGDLVAREPALTPDIVFGVRAAALLEEHLETHVLDAWRTGRSSLRLPLPDHSTRRQALWS